MWTFRESMLQVKINKHLTKQGMSGIRVQFPSLLFCQKHPAAQLLLESWYLQNLQSQCQRVTKCGGSKTYIFAFFNVAFSCKIYCLCSGPTTCTVTFNIPYNVRRYWANLDFTLQHQEAWSWETKQHYIPTTCKQTHYGGKNWLKDKIIEPLKIQQPCSK